MRNMRSIGIDLAPHVERGLLTFHAARPTSLGLETHLAVMYKLVRDLDPAVGVVDPISNFLSVGTYEEVRVMLMRLVDFLKSRSVTGLFTSLNHGNQANEHTVVGISSLIDTWLLLRDVESSGERNRVLHLLKSRGMAHSNQVREFLITSDGLELVPTYVGAEGVLSGLEREQEIERRRRDLDRRRQEVEQQIAALRMALDGQEAELDLAIRELQGQEAQLGLDRDAMARSRWTTTNGGKDT